MAVKRGLGKGLSALIAENVAEIEENEQKGISTLGINEIEPNRNQPRQGFNEESLRELSESIAQYGIIQPIIVCKKDRYYEIIAGERRWRAARIAGVKEIPVIIKDFTDEETLEISLIENIQRDDLNPIEEAKAYQRLVNDFHLKQEEIAEKVSKSRSAITNIMRLLQLDDRVQKMVIDGILTSGHARAILSIEDLTRQYEIAMKIYDEDLTVRETERLIKELKKRKNDSKTVEKEKEIDPIYEKIADRMKEIMGTKVEIIRGKKKGKIEIEYYTQDDLERIIQLIERIPKKNLN